MVVTVDVLLSWSKYVYFYCEMEKETIRKTITVEERTVNGWINH